MKSKIILLTVLIFSTFLSIADEGMWLFTLLNKKYEDIKKQGCRLTPEDIYDINKASIKDAIVGLAFAEDPLSFFCSASLVSNQGLVFTNHHCGYEFIQKHSTIEHNYLAEGFWAKSKEEELPNENLCASILIRVEDVTNQILKGLEKQISYEERQSIIQKRIDSIKNEVSIFPEHNYQIIDLFKGNQYLLLEYKTFYDVRLVGAPPSNIGEFGGDTDNWVWPRHTGDFSIFRIYTAPNGEPAQYNIENIPYIPKYYLKINANGVKKGDFTMVIGFPGETNRYATSYEVKHEIEVIAPSIVKIREKKLSILMQSMKKSKELYITFANKYKEWANYYKYYLGEQEQVRRNKLIDKKNKEEQLFLNWINSDTSRYAEYKDVLSTIKEHFERYREAYKTQIYLNEAFFNGINIISAYYNLNNIKLYLPIFLMMVPEDSVDYYNKIIISRLADELYKEYDETTDKEMFKQMLTLFIKDVHSDFVPERWKKINNVDAYVENLYKKSIFANKQKFINFFNKGKKQLDYITKDPINIFIQDLENAYYKINLDKTELDESKRLWIKSKFEIYPDSIFYPDANSTIRFSYGNVEDYFPQDGIHYDYCTTIEGIMEKSDNENDEFKVPAKLSQLYRNKDFGNYINEQGTVPVCFITTNDITGGNSGSAVIDADGKLVGLAFDGNWEGMSSDIQYDIKLQRTICVDIRYVLFIIDKFAGAKNILAELIQ